MRAPRISRRSLLVGGGIGIGLLVGYAAWPRRYVIGMNTAPGEHVLSAFVKVGEDGHVTVVVPQVELGQGVFTAHAQIVADELGADWRTIAVETARPGRSGANKLFAREWAEGMSEAAPAWLVDNWAERHGLAVTGGSTSVRGFEARLRDAGAAARALLCAAAAARWDADWQACETHGGFVWHGDEKMRFGQVAAEAARLEVPAEVAWRTSRLNRLAGQDLPRLDLPAKVDGSINYAADIRLPDMVFAAIAQGPIGDARLKSFDKAAAMAISGVIEVVESERWLCVVASNGWAAERALTVAAPRFTVAGTVVGDRQIAKALEAAFESDGVRQVEQGDISTAFRGASVLTQTYRASIGAHAPIETATATAWLRGGTLEIWTATQVPGLAADAVARALDIDAAKVVVHPMMVGGSFGARYEVDIVGVAALLAQKLKRPVQLTRSRTEETRRDAFRAPAVARMAARVAPDGRIAAWYAQIASPATLHEMRARSLEGKLPHEAIAASVGVSEPAAAAGAVPSYDIPVLAIDHYPASVGIPTGDWRGRAYVSNAFFRECFFDEIAHQTGGDPFGARMSALGGNPRLAQCLTKVAAMGGWQGGGRGTNQGLACHAMAGSYIAVLAEARLDGARVMVDRLFAVADIGRLINPGIVRAQIIGGLVFGMSAATGAPVSIHRGLAGPSDLGALRLPTLADCPQIQIELILGNEAPGGAGELAVPPVAPAIAGALFAATGVRYRQMPLIQDV